MRPTLACPTRDQAAAISDSWIPGPPYDWSRRRAGLATVLPAIQDADHSQGEDGISMGTDDKARNKAEELKGKAKEGLGRATDDEELEAEGRTDQAESDLKQAGEKVKDAFKR
jgi:uncharacterized protein YjbJ (UPF0337 family)